MESDLVYQALRAEILRIEDAMINITIYMHVTFAALFVVGFGSDNLMAFIIATLVLIPFQGLLNKQKWAINKVSFFIKIFIEDERDDIHWESIHKESEFREFEVRVNKSTFSIIVDTTSLQLALLSLIVLFIKILMRLENIFVMPMIDVCYIIFECIAVFLVFITSDQYRKRQEMIDEYCALLNAYKKK